MMYKLTDMLAGLKVFNLEASMLTEQPRPSSKPSSAARHFSIPRQLPASSLSSRRKLSASSAVQTRLSTSNLLHLRRETKRTVWSRVDWCCQRECWAMVSISSCN